VSLGRIRAVVRKELRDYRRNRFTITTTAVMPVVFLVAPTVTLLKVPASTATAIVQRAVGTTSLLLLVVPAVIPPIIAAYSVIGERDQGTLEPFLTTPVRRVELLLGKAAAAFVPSVAVAYAIYLVFALVVRFAAVPAVGDAVLRTSQVLTQVLFTPLIAVWAIWVGIAMSVRARDVRVAQQLATLGSLPALGFAALISFRVVTPSVLLAVVLAFALLVVDVGAWRLVARMFDRERLLTGARTTVARRPGPTARS
jgi:ABC-2 type transport system permease protein